MIHGSYCPTANRPYPWELRCCSHGPRMVGKMKRGDEAKEGPSTRITWLLGTEHKERQRERARCSGCGIYNAGLGMSERARVGGGEGEERGVISSRSIAARYCGVRSIAVGQKSLALEGKMRAFAHGHWVKFPFVVVEARGQKEENGERRAKRCGVSSFLYSVTLP